MYKGKFFKDLPHGKGVATSVRGDIYKGDVQEAKKHGLGIYTWPSGTKYDGSWYKD
jgi:hypothetical protein